jgi:hypothetical protein
MPPVLPGNSNVETGAHAESERARSVAVSEIMQKNVCILPDFPRSHKEQPGLVKF